MQPTTTIALVAAVLTGCASTAPQYGSFLQGQQGELIALAADAAKKLCADREESTEFQLVHPVADAFGRSLVEQLEDSGHHVSRTETLETGNPVSSVRLGYVVDQLRGTTLLRLTLVVGDSRLSRAYARKGETLHPAGPWSSGGTL